MTADTEHSGLIEQLRLAAKRMEDEPCLNDSGLLFKAADYIEQQFVALAELIEAGKEFAVCDSLDAQKRFKSALDLAAHQRISKACWNNHEDAGMNEEERDKGRMTTGTERAELIALLKAEVAYKSGSEYDDYLLRALLRRTVAYIEQHPPVDAVHLIVRSCCESEPADPDSPDTICINVLDLQGIVASHLGALILADDPIPSVRQSPVDAAVERDAARWRYIARKLCLTGNGNGTCAMQAINLPEAIQGWPGPGEVEEFCGKAIDAALTAQQQDDAVERNWQGEEGIDTKQQESGS